MTQPFAAGDLLIAATDVDDRNVDLRNHSGAGRVLHYGADFSPKGELRTGQTGLVVGLAIDPADLALYACDPGSQTITRFGRDGNVGGVAPLLPRARIGAMLFLPDGRFVAGLHSRIGEAPGSTRAAAVAGFVPRRAGRGARGRGRRRQVRLPLRHPLGARAGRRTRCTTSPRPAGD